MSKFKILTGLNVTNIAGTRREVKTLELAIENKIDPTDRDMVVYAYHFIRLQQLLLAQKYLNKLDRDYFDNGVYKDLARALLVWSIVTADPSKKSPQASVVYEYFIILKRSLEMFEDVNFVSKPAFYRFKKEFEKFTTILSV